MGKILHKIFRGIFASQIPNPDKNINENMSTLNHGQEQPERYSACIDANIASVNLLFEQKNLCRIILGLSVARNTISEAEI